MLYAFLVGVTRLHKCPGAEVFRHGYMWSIAPLPSWIQVKEINEDKRWFFTKLVLPQEQVHLFMYIHTVDLYSIYVYTHQNHTGITLSIEGKITLGG